MCVWYCFKNRFVPFSPWCSLPGLCSTLLSQCVQPWRDIVVCSLIFNKRRVPILCPRFEYGLKYHGKVPVLWEFSFPYIIPFIKLSVENTKRITRVFRFKSFFTNLSTNISINYTVRVVCPSLREPTRVEWRDTNLFWVPIKSQTTTSSLTSSATCKLPTLEKQYCCTKYEDLGVWHRWVNIDGSTHRCQTPRSCCPRHTSDWKYVLSSFTVSESLSWSNTFGVWVGLLVRRRRGSTGESKRGATSRYQCRRQGTVDGRTRLW